MSAIIFDTETTGINDPEIIEAAWLKINNPFSLAIEEKFLSRYKPSKQISLGAMATHHIMDEDLIDCPLSSEFTLPDGVEYLIGHNIDFDWKVIGQPDIKRICTLALSRKLFPEADSHSQSAMIYMFERDSARNMLRNAHAALDDVINCRVVLDYIINKLGNITDWESLWIASEEARIPTVMPFGKHKDLPISEVPSDYKRWLLGQADVDPYLIKALRK
jgi:exodeoxyribonuclease X